ncbi:aspartate aminotransferase family protein [Pseudomonas syringae group genomosp. 3]|uniref:aspartate aminotransferase family protein n=1 Tax=Pseudomonas syringae group genomosp. 3 TaxID=251701 RepID=UPI0006E66658|nr:aspartate aminotransferase family protein [Pseudomonas syringae group genomosp. 3]KPW60820.1 Acetylornithine aminotransferase [Pseudomonas syringae pv. berberidis]KPY13074.1 Acetylornithine aminotransferase [Pseudomonas syringae pv. philadelphi]RMM15295.1 Acetylornithine aminotransferase [Pseudomonas syringae pv. berberidis]RMP65543.1 Acetylornithine aminotransferase [Pseudomonas syringae pv. berberidis]RMQ39263.1 Acetylornithine aminotransferase [Pseudomonas syringae pv. berberidis]
MTIACLMSTYQPLALSFTRGLGTRLWDQSGREYLDAVAGVAVTNVGHSHPMLVDAIRDQAGLLLHTSNLYSIDWQQRLAQKLTRLAGMDRVFFNNSGAEANETALKLARLHGWHKYIEQPLVVVMENAFHGRTLGTLAASDGPAVRLSYSDLPGDYIKVPFGDLLAFDKVCVTHGHRIAAVLVEPIQGEGGAQVAPAGYLKALRERCTRRDWLLMLDEIQTGMGRTGKWFAFQHEGIVPDVMTLAKGLGNGIPIGACLARGKAAELFTPGSHGSTFGGNPLACRVGCTVIDIIEQQALVENARVRGQHLLGRLQEVLGGHPQVMQVRGRGLMIGIELREAIPELTRIAAEQHGLLINVTRGKVIRLLPPLVLEAAEVEQIVQGLAASLDSASYRALERSA